MTALLLLGAGLAAVQSTLASAIKARDSTTANVYFNNNTGPPEHLAAGILYGVPDAQGQIQDHWYENMGFNYLRAGGAQLPAPARGWIWGLTEYEVRLKWSIRRTTFIIHRTDSNPA